MKTKEKEVDIIIIGAGASGAAAAWNLSKTNYKIVCLEQGPLVNKNDYCSFQYKWEKLKKKKFNINPNIRKLKQDYPIDDKNSPISIANFNAVGGSTILYSGHFPRFHVSDFKTKTLDDVGKDWPITYSDLEKYYDLNDKMMGVAGLTGDPVYPKILNLKQPVPLGYAGEKIAKGFNKLGWHWWPSYSAVTKKINGKYQKMSVDKNYWPKAIKNGVNLKTNCKVKKIVSKASGQVSGVIYLDAKNKEKFLGAKLVILACSGIGTPRLLLNSANDYYPKGLANSSGLVGKNLMLHPLGYVEGIFKNFLASNYGPEGCCLASHEFYETKKLNEFKRGYTIHVLRGTGPLETAMNSLKLKRLKFGKSFHKDFLKIYGCTIPLAIICEDLPEKTNFIELDNSKKDSGGIPGVKINYSLNKNTKKMLAHGIEKGKKIMKTIGAHSILSFAPVRHTGWHTMGTACMGVSAKDSVVNSFGQTHDIKNLVVVDSSIFTTSGGVNPMSTIQALSLKITDDIKSSPNRFFL